MKYVQEQLKYSLSNWDFESAERWMEFISDIDKRELPQYVRFLADIGKLDKVKDVVGALKSNPLLNTYLSEVESYSVCRNLINFDLRICAEYESRKEYFSKLYVYSMCNKTDKIFDLLTAYRDQHLTPKSTSEQNMILNFAVNKLIDANYINADIVRALIAHVASCSNINLVRKKYLTNKLIGYTLKNIELSREFFNLKDVYVVHIRVIPLIQALTGDDCGGMQLQQDVYRAIQKFNNLSFAGERKAPKIAVCISGMFKTDTTNLSDIYEKLVKPLNADVFLHCWDRQQDWAGDVRRYNFWHRVFGVKNSEVPSNLLNLKFLELNYPNVYNCLLSSSFVNLDIKSINQYGDTKKFLVESENEFLQRFAIDDGYKTRGTFNQVKMFYGMYKSFELLKEYEQENNFEYDYVVRLRTDAVINANNITIGHLESLDDSLVAVHSGSGWGISDGFFYATRNSYEKIVGIWREIISSKSLSPFIEFADYDAHKLLGLWLIRNNIHPVNWKLSCGTIVAGSNFKVPNLKDALSKDCGANIRIRYPEETEWLLTFFKDKSK